MKNSRKKNRKQIRIKRNLKRFMVKCKRCVSCDKNFCKDLELQIENVWDNGKYKFGTKCDVHNRRCSWFKNKNTGSHVK